MQRAVKSLQAFDFRSDFTPPPEPEVPTLPVEEKITLSAPDLAMLLTEAHAAAMSLRHDEQAARLKQLTENLTEALANLVSLAQHLESSAYSDGLRQSALRLVTATAQRIVDGQGDLFAQNREFSQNSTPTEKDGS